MKHAVSALLVLAIAAPAFGQTKVDRGGRNFFSKQQDIEIGQESSAEAEKQLPILGDPQVEAYVSDLGRRLAAQAPGYRFPYSFKVVDISDINAFALPGGPVYVNRGTIEAARTEGELAGVIAHEISHVDLRHGTRQASKAVMAQMGLQLLGSLIGGSGNTRDMINAVGGFGLNTLFLKYSRAAESDADVEGSQIMTRAGYDPREMANFFDVFAQQSTHRTKEFFSDHPSPEHRRERIEQEAKLLGANPRPVSQASFQDTQARLHRLPPARSAADVAKNPPASTGTGGTSGSGSTLPGRRGTVEAPSHSLEWYSSPSRAFRVAHPDNWGIVGESDSEVTLAPSGGAYQASNGSVDLDYGAIVGVRQAGSAYRRAGDTQLDADTDAYVSQLRQGSPYLRAVSGSRRPVTIDNGDGLVVTLSGVSPSTGVRERVNVVTTELGDGRMVTMLYVTPDAAPRDYDDLLEAMIRNLRVAGR